MKQLRRNLDELKRQVKDIEDSMRMGVIDIVDFKNCYARFNKINLKLDKIEGRNKS